MQKNKINFFSNFNIDNFQNTISEKLENYDVNIYSNSLIIDKLKKKILDNSINIFLLDTNLIDDNFIKYFYRSLTNENSLKIILLFSFQPKEISLPILRKNYKSESQLIFEFQKKLHHKNIIQIDVNYLKSIFDGKIYNFKRWFQSKIPFSIQFENFIFNEIMALIELINGKRKKAIFLDLDDTLWGGTLAEIGYKKLNLGGINAEGEAFKKLQHTIKKFQKTGIILGIISRNDEKTALEAIKKHPEMILKRKDFAGWKINQKNKSENILSLCKELNIKPNSVVFIDNSKYEREEVRAKIPDVLVPDLDEVPFDYFNVLKNLRELSFFNLSKEDLNRSKDYTRLKEAKMKRLKYSSHEDWLKSLKMKVTLEKFKKENLERIHQMYNKINQLNSTTRRLNRANIIIESKKKRNFIVTLRLKDNIIDFGIIGLIKYKISDKIVVVEDFLFSCRGLGRKIEKFFLEKVLNPYLSMGFSININFKQSDKNKLCEDLFNEVFEKKKGKKTYICKSLIDKTYKSKIIDVKNKF